MAPPTVGAQMLSSPVGTEPATPELIERAEERGDLDLERASLYRVYALTDDRRLPVAFRSNRPWRGTLVDLKLRRDLPDLDAGPERRAALACAIDSASAPP